MKFNVIQIAGVIIICLSLEMASANGQTEDVGNTVFLGTCPNNSDSTYDRKEILKSMNRILKNSVPGFDKFPSMGFFIYDLTDPSNNYKSKTSSRIEEGCINFVNNHVYHFSVSDWSYSKSQIAVLENGKMKVFNSINCKGSSTQLEDVLRYVNEKLTGRIKEDTIARIKNYRRYGAYQTVDSTDYTCGDEYVSPNADKLYSRREVLKLFLDTLMYSRSGPLAIGFPYGFIEDSRVVGAFIYDLTEPTNKQSSLLERVEFKNNHIYHFGLIDGPFSFSNIAILENGNLKIFKAVNCGRKGNSLKEVIDYLEKKLQMDPNKDDIIRRVKDYRSYGVYATLNGISTPQCEKLDNEM